VEQNSGGSGRRRPERTECVGAASWPVRSDSSGSVSTESSTAAQGSEGGGYGTGDDEWKSFFFLPPRLSPSMVVMVVSLVVRRIRRHSEDDNEGAATASPPSHGGHESFDGVGTSRQWRGARRRHRELLLPSLSMASTAASRRQRMVASWVMAATKSQLRTATSRVAVATGPSSSSRHISFSVSSSTTAAQWPSLASTIISLSLPSSLPLCSHSSLSDEDHYSTVEIQRSSVESYSFLVGTHFQPNFHPPRVEQNCSPTTLTLSNRPPVILQ
ncbi:hypothetical protein PIB30_101252, partial [Stylosanthes scabra]|nr:hypothetical protein [Stylosanthes scabra]